MNNQWGRGGIGTASGGGGGGLGGILFASLICLALGGAGGYGASRFLGSDGSLEIAERDQRIADLARELDGRAAASDDDGKTIESLRQDNERLKAQAENASNVAAQPSADTSAAVAETARLKRDVVPKLQDQVQLLSQRVADVEAMKARAEEAVRDRERKLSLRTDEIARLEASIKDIQGERTTAQNADALRLQAEADSLRTQLKEAVAAEETLRSRDIPALQKEVAYHRNGAEELLAQNKALEEKLSGLEDAARKAAQASRPVAEPEKSVPDSTEPEPGRDPRNVTLVADALRGAPGLDRLTGSQRDGLERALVSGECVTNALGSVFSRVPVLTLRNLMRDLDSDC